MKSTNLFISLAALGAVTAASAEPYQAITATVDTGGGRSASSSYSNDGSLGGIAGISSAVSPAATAKHGYIGQLSEVTGFQIAALPLTVDEGSSRQISAAQTYDDATTATVDPASVAWSVVSGPVGSISQAGLATAGSVYQTTPATVQGVWGGYLATLGLSVVNSSPDNYQTYAGDGIDDGWQFQYFGAPPNTNAGPTADPDHDSQSNLFEFVAGVAPNDAASRFLLRIDEVAGQPSQKKLIFSPRLGDRSYTVESNIDLGVTWSPVPGIIVSDNGAERTATDPNASDPKKFYRVNIGRP